MRPFLILLSSLILTANIAYAKTLPPNESRLIFVSLSEEGNDSIEYKVKFEFKPLITCENIIFTLELPEGLELQNGFSTWHGELTKNDLFEREFTLKAVDKKHYSMKMIVQMQISASAKSANILSIDLSAETNHEKARTPQSDPKHFRETLSRSRRIRRY